MPKACHRVPTEIQKHNSMIFPGFSIINNVISMTIWCTASNLPFSGIITTLSINVEYSNSNVFKISLLVDHAMHFEIIKTWNH